MTLRRLKEAAVFAAFGFVSDLASTRFCLSAANRQVGWAIFWNLILMVLTFKMIQRTKDRMLMACWIAGQSLGIWLALTL